MCKLCLKGKIYIFTWNRKLNWLYKENAQLREYCLRLKQTWQSEIGNKEILIWPIMKPIKNSNLKDWNCTKRINGLKEKRLTYAESKK